MRRAFNLAVSIALTIWVACLFLAPLTLPPNTVYLGENGRANCLDFPEKWETLPLFQRIIYYIGDVNCHQKASRSFFINGNQMPVCARDVGVFVGALVASYTSFLFKVEPESVLESFFSILPRAKKWSSSKKRVVFLLFLAAATAPIAIDGFAQLLTPYESTNLTRVVTGFLFGYAWCLVLILLLCSDIAYERRS